MEWKGFGAPGAALAAPDPAAARGEELWIRAMSCEVAAARLLRPKIPCACILPAHTHTHTHTYTHTHTRTHTRTHTHTHTHTTHSIPLGLTRGQIYGAGGGWDWRRPLPLERFSLVRTSQSLLSLSRSRSSFLCPTCVNPRQKHVFSKHYTWSDPRLCRPLCAGCHKLLTAADLQPLPPPLCSQKQQQQQAKGPESPPVLDCFACHRCFHARCHRVWVAQQQQQRPDPQQKQQASQRKGAQSGGNGSRQQVHRALQHLCWAGDIPCEQPMGRTSAAPIGGNAAESDDIHLVMRLYDCRNLGLATSAGLRRAHSVLRQEFGYSLTDLRQFDFAALLTRGATPVSAAILDVYGADVAELCLMATRTAMQRCGYGTALLRQLSTELGGAGEPDGYGGCTPQVAKPEVYS
ncbi:hypothetical protein Vretifemale_4514 [Volvox reticuliferus]|uniref:Increased DNA methylation 1 C-terminal domain-containing protein n=1 Tax=Volvox reticuliferus TaxID=1737510 RepID=A0A8J4C327_9CHLO|nr:hypothetical protein Vretifemale_4514 [Volvox reticuliferus]